jgi:hypothetical protein
MEQHDAYDAKSRSVKLPPLIDSLGSPKQNISREDLSVEGARVFVLHNFMSSEECKFFIDATESMYKI